MSCNKQALERLDAIMDQQGVEGSAKDLHATIDAVRAKSPENLGCVLQAVMVYVQTGDPVQAVLAFLRCAGMAGRQVTNCLLGLVTCLLQGRPPSLCFRDAIICVIDELDDGDDGHEPEEPEEPEEPKEPGEPGEVEYRPGNRPRCN